MTRRADIEHRSQEAIDRLREAIIGDVRLVVVKAPPGSGKTYLLLKGAEAGVVAGQRLAVSCFTNAQADDICRRLATDYPDLPAFRFASAGHTRSDLGASVSWITETANLPIEPSVTLATGAKWSTVNLPHTFDVLLVDEAWQLAWADFMLLGAVSARFALIGDPGQIPPVVSIDVSRWETSPRAPHLAAPEVILADDGLRMQAEILELPACRRLPHDSVDLIQQFYDFGFEAWADPGDRSVSLGTGNGMGLDGALDLWSSGSYGAATIPTPPEGPPLELDPDVAQAVASLASRLVERGGTVDLGDGPRPMSAGDIGIAATHRVMGGEIERRLAGPLRGRVRVATPERWQGLERPLMLVVHPLSGVDTPTAFDLDTGRLCVMASRHQAGVLVVTRDHVPRTLGSFVPMAEQAVGRPDVAGRGHDQHVRFWERLAAGGRVTGL